MNPITFYSKPGPMTLEINEKFPEIRAYYKKEPGLHAPSEWGLQEE